MVLDASKPAAHKEVTCSIALSAFACWDAQCCTGCAWNTGCRGKAPASACATDCSTVCPTGRESSGWRTKAAAFLNTSSACHQSHPILKHRADPDAGAGLGGHQAEPVAAEHNADAEEDRRHPRQQVAVGDADPRGRADGEAHPGGAYLLPLGHVHEYVCREQYISTVVLLQLTGVRGLKPNLESVLDAASGPWLWAFAGCVCSSRLICMAAIPQP